VLSALALKSLLMISNVTKVEQTGCSPRFLLNIEKSLDKNFVMKGNLKVAKNSSKVHT
jgi:hypothetical protein